MAEINSKLYLVPNTRIKKGKKECDWLGHVECMWHKTYIQHYQKSLIKVSNQLCFRGAYVYCYRATDMMTYLFYCGCVRCFCCASL